MHRSTGLYRSIYAWVYATAGASTCVSVDRRYLRRVRPPRYSDTIHCSTLQMLFVLFHYSFSIELHLSFPFFSLKTSGELSRQPKAWLDIQLVNIFFFEEYPVCIHGETSASEIFFLNSNLTHQLRLLYYSLFYCDDLCNIERERAVYVLISIYSTCLHWLSAQEGKQAKTLPEDETPRRHTKKDEVGKFKPASIGKQSCCDE